MAWNMSSNIAFISGFLSAVLLLLLINKCNNNTRPKIETKIIEKVETLKIVIRDTIKVFSSGEIKLIKCDSARIKFDFQTISKKDFVFVETSKIDTQKIEKEKIKEKNFEIGIGMISKNIFGTIGYKNVNFIIGYDIERNDKVFGIMIKKEF